MSHTLAMEWQKLRPFGKTSRTVALTIGLAVSVSAIVSAAMASGAKHMTLADRSSFDSVGISLQGVNAAVLAIAAFGVLSMTREYSTGMISLTFLAQPRRLRVLAAKLVTHSTVAAIAGLGACLAAFAVGQALLGTEGLDNGWTSAHLPSALAGGVVYLLLLCAWGVALGALLRTSAAAITWMASLLVVAPVIVQILPESVVHRVERWLPSQIGSGAMSAHSDPHLFTPWAGLAVLGGYVVLTLVAAAWRMARTDP
ncbi:MAG TPA: ABC transporter permease [Acidothermaceae bacterium]|nr:ABC transporter permease [Acidothermaceae bacterium]